MLMVANLTDEQLIRKSLDGDEEAFGEVIRRWERKIFALCYGILGCREEALDATQEAFMLAYKNLSGFRGEAKVSSWLHRIAINQCLTRMCSAKSREESLEFEEGALVITSSSNSPFDVVEEKERALLIRKAIRSLPFELRQIVIMKEFEDMTFQEIAEVLDMPVSTVKSRLYLALRQLKLRLENKFSTV